MAQVWIIVVGPFVGLVIVTSLVIGVLGLGQYRFDRSPAALFRNTTCYVNSSSLLPFSSIPLVPGYTSNCGVSTTDCWGVMWEVEYNSNRSGWIYSSGYTHSNAASLQENFQVGQIYTCWYLSSEDSIISWEDWSPTPKDIEADVNMMTAGFASVVAFAMVLCILGVTYFRVGEEKEPIYHISHGAAATGNPTAKGRGGRGGGRGRADSSESMLLRSHSSSSSSSSSNKRNSYDYESALQSPT